MGWAMAGGTSFWSSLLIPFLSLSSISTKCTFEFLKGSEQPFRSYFMFGRKLGEQWLEVQVLIFSFNSFLIFLFYSYEMHLRNFERLRAAVQELLYVWWKIWWAMAGGMSFWSFLLIPFLIFSSIATKCTCEFLKDSEQPFRSYFMFGAKLGEQWRVFDISFQFFFYFAFLQLTYKMHLQNFERLRAAVHE